MSRPTNTAELQVRHHPLCACGDCCARDRQSAACEWCSRAIAQDAEGRWYAVKGAERGYDPLACEASDDGRHNPPGMTDDD